MKTLIAVIAMLFTVTAFGQSTEDTHQSKVATMLADTSLTDTSAIPYKPVASVVYAGSYPKMYIGFGVMVHFNKWTILSTTKFNENYSGTFVPAHENKGYYEIGMWGNKATGNKEEYVFTKTVRTDVGLGYTIYHKKDFNVKPYVGVGVTFVKTATDTYLEAEDVTSGVNAYGYYWVNAGTTTKTKASLNSTVGCMIQKNHVVLGVGYDFNPKGVVVMVGLNFFKNEN